MFLIFYHIMFELGLSHGSDMRAALIAPIKESASILMSSRLHLLDTVPPSLTLLLSESAPECNVSSAMIG